jgi:gallate decarboxylase subunit D
MRTLRRAKQETGIALIKGSGRTGVHLWAAQFGEDLIVKIYNENAHLGAVGVSEFDSRSDRCSTSVVTLLGHKDDGIASAAASLICKTTRRNTCVIAGIHLDDITGSEIKKIVANANALVSDYLAVAKLE